MLAPVAKVTSADNLKAVGGVPDEPDNFTITASFAGYALTVAAAGFYALSGVKFVYSGVHFRLRCLHY
jgi:hypothetical protein